MLFSFIIRVCGLWLVIDAQGYEISTIFHTKYSNFLIFYAFFYASASGVSQLTVLRGCAAQAPRFKKELRQLVS